MAERFAPPGEKLGIGGWLRRLGFTGSDQISPPRVWERLNVALISDERELVSFMPGPRASAGGTQGAVIGEFSVFQLIGGATGARAAFASNINVRFFVAAPLTVNTPVVLPVSSSDLSFPATSFARRGSVVAEPEPTSNAATLIGSAPWGGAPPDIWVPPGRALIVYSVTVAATINLAFLWREPGTP